jgi:hypothetical protein
VPNNQRTPITSTGTIIITVGVLGIFGVLAMIGFSTFGQGNGSSTPNEPQQPVVNSYDVGLNAGRSLRAQNTLLFPNRTALCGEVFQKYTSQNLDFNEFMRGCQDGF